MIQRFDKVYSMDYDKSGLNMVMSVQLSGMRDIVVFNVASGTFERITQDLADDIDPKFVDNSTKIVYEDVTHNVSYYENESSSQVDNSSDEGDYVDSNLKVYNASQLNKKVIK